MYENYLLNPEALAHVASGTEGFHEDGRNVAPEQVKAWIEEHGREPRYSKEEAEGTLIGSAFRLAEVDAAKLLKDLFNDLSESRVVYDKVSHSVAFTRRLRENAPEDLREATDLIAKRLGRDTTTRPEGSAA